MSKMCSICGETPVEDAVIPPLYEGAEPVIITIDNCEECQEDLNLARSRKKSKQRRAKIMESIIGENNIFLDASFDNIDSKTLRARVKDIDYRNVKNIYIQGETGEGKTFIGYAILREMCMKGLDVMVIESYKLKELYMATFNDDYEYKREAILKLNQIENCDVLLVDDLDKAIMSEGFRKAWWAIIDQRYIRGRVTVYSSQEDIEAFCGNFPKKEDRDSLERRMKNKLELIKL